MRSHVHSTSTFGSETQLQSLVAAAFSLLLVYNKRECPPMSDFKERMAAETGKLSFVNYLSTSQITWQVPAG